MHHQQQINIKLSGLLFAILFSLSLCCASLSSASATEKSDLAKKVFTVGIAIPKALGLGMAGQKHENQQTKISFARKLGVSNFLKSNNMSLAHVRLSEYQKNKLYGSFTYKNSIERTAHYAFDITYAETGKNHYLVKNRRITAFEPIIPQSEIHFIPAKIKSLQQMKSMSITDLLLWARKNNEKVLPETPPGAVKDYAVLCFNMDRLSSGAKLNILSTGKSGTTWSKDGWHVAYINSKMALNSSVAVTFSIAHTRGKESIDKGNTLIIARFSNQYWPPLPPAPMSKIDVPPAVKKLLTRYHSNNLPDLK